MSPSVSAGETLVGRKLLTERRAGVPHYVPGQMVATVTDPKVLREWGVDDGGLAAEVTYVDARGHAIFVLCTKDPDGEWEPGMIGSAGPRLFEGWKVVGVDVEFALTEQMREHLARAEKEVLGG